MIGTKYITLFMLLMISVLFVSEFPKYAEVISTLLFVIIILFLMEAVGSILYVIFGKYLVIEYTPKRKKIHVVNVRKEG